VRMVDVTDLLKVRYLVPGIILYFRFTG